MTVNVGFAHGLVFRPISRAPGHWAPLHRRPHLSRHGQELGGEPGRGEETPTHLRLAGHWQQQEGASGSRQGS